MKESSRVLYALIAAIISGAMIGASRNSALLRVPEFVAPVGTLWVNAIRMTVIPLVVSLLITGIASPSDTKSIGRLGRRTLAVFLVLASGVAFIMVPVAAAIFGALPPLESGKLAIPQGAAEATQQIGVSGQTPTLAGWLTSLVPVNPIAAAANGAMIPLIIFTLLFALAVSNSSSVSREPLLGFFRAVGDAMLLLVRWIIRLAPIGVFALVLPLAAHVGPSMAGAIGFYIAAYSLGCLLVVGLLTIVASIGGGISIVRFARAALPAQLIAFSSSSSIASLPALVESAERGLALPNRVTSFVLPLAVSTFKVAAPVSWTTGALFIAWFFGVPLHARELATVAFAAVLLGFGVPGIPRGAFVMLTPLFVAIGLPVAGIGILIAVDAVPDTFATMLNVTGDLAAATIVSRFEDEGYAPRVGRMTAE